MSRLLFVLLAGCSTGVVGIPETTPSDPTDGPQAEGPGTGFQTEPWEDPDGEEPAVDDPRYDGAYARILSPRAGEVIPEGARYAYQVGLFAADGSPLEGAVGVEWHASDDPDFESDRMTFETDALAIGSHVITAVVDLANGDRMAHAVGGVRVQSPHSGTYAGLFSVDGTVTQVTVTCSGSAVVVVDPEGELGEGSGDCLVSLLGIDVPMTWLFSLESSSDGLIGSAGVELLGFFSYEIPMIAGSSDPEGEGLVLSFEGPIPFVGELSATLEAPRISLDSE